MKLNNWIIPKAFAFVIMGILWSCDSSDVPQNIENDDNPLVDIVLSRSEQEWVESNVEFSNKLMTALAQEKQENFLVSPYALANNLLLIANGCEGEGRTQILEALYPGGENLQDINLLYERLLTTLPFLDKKCDFTINTCHLRHHLPYTEQYTEEFIRVLETFKVDTFPVFDTQEELYIKLEQWSEQCIGLSPSKEILDDIPFEAILTNALSFEGKWRKAFDADKTKKRTFYGRNKTSATEMMVDTEKLGRFWQDDDFTWAMWPYGNEAFSFVVAMPSVNATSIPALDEKWLTESLTAASKASLTMPKFTLEGNIELMNVLRAIGVEAIFNPKEANLSGMYSSLTESEIRPSIGPVFQDFHFKVDEEGTKVSLASTSTEIIEIANPFPIDEVVIDHPFYFFIREQSTGLILFMGKIEDL
ncbi:MAG: hypothetical protein LIO90_10480 [Bacteroidales bacterium]|nr:hypothetical protein [Bacteroidales bacterium]